MPRRRPALSRRRFLAGGGALALAAIGPGAAQAQAQAPATRDLALTVRPGSAPILGPGRPVTAILGYDGLVPGPAIRVRQGERVRIAVRNALAEDTTVHWHGIRLPVAMDGVPDLTQKPIAPGERFDYAFFVPDAGTCWYHSHVRSAEQIDRGLHGAFIVEERTPPAVDRDVTWLLDDWRLGPDGQIAGGYGDDGEMRTGGRIGETVTIDGRLPAPFAVRAGERIRLRLINAANARIFALRFAGHVFHVIALDGQPVAPHVPEDGRVVLGPAMRADLILDATGGPGTRHAVTDDFYPGGAYRLTELAYGTAPPRRVAFPPVPALPPNTMPEPDLARAIRHRIVMTGGGDSVMAHGRAWAFNGVAGHGHHMPPLYILPRDASCVFELVNDTGFPHPVHLHGFAFRVLSRNGRPPPRPEWRDTILVMAGERAEIGFVADNPGDWMLHCHIAEHMDGGMMNIVRVD